MGGFFVWVSRLCQRSNDREQADGDSNCELIGTVCNDGKNTGGD